MMTAEKIENEMMALADEAQAVNLSRFFKCGKGEYGEGDKFLGIKVPVTRGLVKENWRNATLEDISRLIVSPYHEIRLCALLLLVQLYKHAGKSSSSTKPSLSGKSSLRERIVDYYLAHTQYINNWDLVDLSCYEILGDWVWRTGDSSILYSLAQGTFVHPQQSCDCAKSANPTMWEKRIAMVSCMALVRHGQLSDCLQIADILLYEREDLMHKAVGWMLREVGKRDPQAERDFLATRCLTMPRTTLRYAIEKFPEEERQSYLKNLVSGAPEASTTPER